MSFGSRVAATRAAYGPVCVGIDPHPMLLERWGLDDTVTGLGKFVGTCIEAFAGRVGFIKPQAALFERFGSQGIKVLEELLGQCRHTGSLLIVDAKRGDIGSTAQAYAQAYLDDDSPLAADAMTVNPFLGLGTLDPFIRQAELSDAGVFVLARTSNPESHDVQQALQGSSTVAETILEDVRGRNGDASPMGSVGAVIGATINEAPTNMDINGPILVPGLGAQGATSQDVQRLFAPCYSTVIAAVSRAILQEGPDIERLRTAVAHVGDSLVSS